MYLQEETKILWDKLAHTFCMQSINNAGSHQIIWNHLMYILFSKNVQIPYNSSKSSSLLHLLSVTLSLSLDSGGLYNRNPDLWGTEVGCSIRVISHKERLKQLLIFSKNMTIIEIDDLNNWIKCKQALLIVILSSFFFFCKGLVGLKLLMKKFIFNIRVKFLLVSLNT